MPQFHISWSEPSDVWPLGAWSLYRVTGDEIAQRISINDDGVVTARSSWPGYIGMFATLSELAVAIAESKNLVAA